MVPLLVRGLVLVAVVGLFWLLQQTTVAQRDQVKINHKIIRERDSDENGPAALATIARHYRHPVTLDDVCSLINMEKRWGTNLLQLRIAAEELGFSACAVKASYNILKVPEKVPLPAIAHEAMYEDFGHFVVIFDVNHDFVTVGDPSDGSIQKRTETEFRQKWTGYLLLIAPKR